MAMGVGTGHGPKSDINMTPMIDILLVLIIIFLVITPIISKGLDALVPQPPKDPKAQATPPDDKRTIVVVIDKEGLLKINQEPTTWDTLGPRLDDIFKTRSERVMFVKGDDSTLFDKIIRIIDIAKGAGVDKIGLITEKIQMGQ
ncbi:MAG: biopolymer transporter ExbD [Acidobacteriia bacterium]|nr:biopolymer transporter ExbD [Terriglobia bacterium]